MTQHSQKPQNRPDFLILIHLPKKRERTTLAPYSQPAYEYIPTLHQSVVRLVRLFVIIVIVIVIITTPDTHVSPLAQKVTDDWIFLLCVAAMLVVFLWVCGEIIGIVGGG